MRTSAPATLAAATVAGAFGGLAGAAVWVLPAWADFTAGLKLAEYAGTVLIIVSVGNATRGALGVNAAALGRALGAALAAALAAAATLAGFLYLLYARVRPELLALRYQASLERVERSGRAPELVSRELARLAVARTQSLDPAAAALEAAAAVGCTALLVALFLIVRARVSARRATARGSP